MTDQSLHRTLALSVGILVGVLGDVGVGHAGGLPPGFDAGGRIVWATGDREEIFTRFDEGCPAQAAPDADTWITVDSPTLDATRAKAAIVFGHGFAWQDDVADPNGVAVFVSRDGATPASSENQLVHSHVMAANEHGDEHGTTIIALDEEKNFKVLYRFGEVFGPAADETALCLWGVRLHLVGYIEADGPSRPHRDRD
jgi:hypothetical protein